MMTAILSWEKNRYMPVYTLEVILLYLLNIPLNCQKISGTDQGQKICIRYEIPARAGMGIKCWLPQ